jgi:hypothetical protein
LRPAALGREQALFIADLPAQVLGPFKCRQHLGRAPAAHRHQRHSHGKLEVYFALICVGDLVGPEQFNT